MTIFIFFLLFFLAPFFKDFGTVFKIKNIWIHNKYVEFSYFVITLHIN